MKKLFVKIGIAVFIFSLAGAKANAQIINGAYQKSDMSQKKPMPLPTVREADVFWSKQVWRIIDLREKMNLPLYYPTADIDGRTNLINLLLKGIESGQITPYDARLDDDFKVPLTYEQVQEAFGAEESTEETIDFDTGERKTVTIQGEIRPGEIKQYMIKEEWYFDKQSSSLNVRIVGICPIREFVRESEGMNQVQRQKVFWVYYPEVRNLLATNLVLNQYNQAQSMSYDDLFIKRFFNSYIVKESNVYNNRDISAYLTGKEAMLESKRIESEIFNFEQDLWEY
ncbi:protein involved in gliding motility GldN [Mariniphaga anaerophila]|uniref:Protein involved in gliding motility GldN n=1 Tax=Mariniphaga anaerophila TaxID=1484053 RepID=A0A1M5FSR6_9BACT|nr:gliding motility protein GldN [Mariniphaga anaerophila]SHF94241.1 protein involved in gliding motility GldN [Mariniphaga anaerophila]